MNKRWKFLFPADTKDHALCEEIVYTRIGPPEYEPNELCGNFWSAKLSTNSQSHEGLFSHPRGKVPAFPNTLTHEASLFPQKCRNLIIWAQLSVDFRSVRTLQSIILSSLYCCSRLVQPGPEKAGMDFTIMLGSTTYPSGMLGIGIWIGGGMWPFAHERDPVVLLDHL